MWRRGKGWRARKRRGGKAGRRLGLRIEAEGVGECLVGGGDGGGGSGGRSGLGSRRCGRWKRCRCVGGTYLAD